MKEKKQKWFVSLSHHNSKMGDMIWSVSQPVGLSCRKNPPCGLLCYGKTSHYLVMPSYKGSVKRNWEAYHSSPNRYFDEIAERTALVKYFRWHVVGDIVDYPYLLGMVKVAKANPGTSYLAFTKRYEFVNLYLSLKHRLPKNLHIIFSAWDKGFKIDNPYNLPVAYVDFKDKSMNPDIPTTALPCAGHCWKCMGCWTLKEGQAVVLHEHR